MTRYLVDTNVISAAAPTTPVKRPEIVRWMDSHSNDLFLSAITVAEIADGIAKIRREGTKRKASDLSARLRIVRSPAQKSELDCQLQLQGGGKVP